MTSAENGKTTPRAEWIAELIDARIAEMWEREALEQAQAEFTRTGPKASR